MKEKSLNQKQKLIIRTVAKLLGENGNEAVNNAVEDASDISMLGIGLLLLLTLTPDKNLSSSVKEQIYGEFNISEIDESALAEAVADWTSKKFRKARESAEV